MINLAQCIMQWWTVAALLGKFYLNGG